MSQINLNVQGIDSAASIEIIAKALGPFGDVKNIHVDWQSSQSVRYYQKLQSSPSVQYYMKMVA